MKKYHSVVTLVREFFSDRDFVEADIQSKVSLLSGFLNIDNIVTFHHKGRIWPVHSSNMLELDKWFLSNMDNVGDGVFCTTHSYSKNGKIRPLIEFEFNGHYKDAVNFVLEFTDFLGFEEDYILQYDEICEHYSETDITNALKNNLREDFGNCCIIVDPPAVDDEVYWNVKVDDKMTYNIDCILCGNVAIQSRELETDVDVMKTRFLAHPDYQKLVNTFGKNRVNSEIENYLSLDHFVRIVGRIDMKLLEHSMSIEKLI